MIDDTIRRPAGIDLDAIRNRDDIMFRRLDAAHLSMTQTERDRRDLLAEVDRLRHDLQELSCGDVRKVCPNCRDLPQ
jgi:hypothetical protein